MAKNAINYLLRTQPPKSLKFDGKHICWFLFKDGDHVHALIRDTNPDQLALIEEAKLTIGEIPQHVHLPLLTIPPISEQDFVVYVSEIDKIMHMPQAGEMAVGVGIFKDPAEFQRTKDNQLAPALGSFDVLFVHNVQQHSDDPTVKAVKFLLEMDDQPAEMKSEMKFDGKHVCWFLFKDNAHVCRVIQDANSTPVLQELLDIPPISEADFFVYISEIDQPDFLSNMGYLPQVDEMAVGVGICKDPEEFQRTKDSRATSSVGSFEVCFVHYLSARELAADSIETPEADDSNLGDGEIVAHSIETPEADDSTMNVINFLLETQSESDMKFDGNHVCWFLFKTSDRVNALIRYANPDDNLGQIPAISNDDFVVYKSRIDPHELTQDVGSLPNFDEMAVGVGIFRDPEEFQLTKDSQSMMPLGPFDVVFVHNVQKDISELDHATMNAVNFLLEMDGQPSAMASEMKFDGNHVCWFLFKDNPHVCALVRDANSHEYDPPVAVPEDLPPISEEYFVVYISEINQPDFLSNIGDLPQPDEMAVGVGIFRDPAEFQRLKDSRATSSIGSFDVCFVHYVQKTQ
jgi:hypothetical protein